MQKNKILEHVRQIREAVELAAQTFEQYAEHHRIKGTTEKAMRNQALALIMRKALAGEK